jgi:HSP20 family protein
VFRDRDIERSVPRSEINIFIADSKEDPMAKPVKPTEVPVKRNLLSRWQEDIDQMERMFDDFWPVRMPRFFDGWRPMLSRAPIARTPEVDVYDEGNQIVVKAEIPGAKKEEIEVNLTDSRLTIRGEKERKEEIKEDQYYRCERSYGSFSRTIQLPSDVQSSKAQASFTDGVLEVRLPKTEEAKRKAVKLKIK